MYAKEVQPILEAAIDAANLVERSDYDNLTQRSNDFRDESRRVTLERDEARREAEDYKEQWEEQCRQRDDAVVHAVNQGKQLAALRGALEFYADPDIVIGRIVDGKIDAQPNGNSVARAALTDTAEAAAQWVRVPEGWDSFVSLVIHACREAARWRMKDGSECWCNRGEPSHSPGCKALAAAYSQAQVLLAAAPQAGAPTTLEVDITDEQKEYVNKLIDDQEKAYDPKRVIGGPQASEPEG